MRKFNLECPIRKLNPYKKAAKEQQNSTFAPNILERKFRESGARQVLLTDITYIIRKNDGKWTYLSIMMDAFTTEILGRSYSESLETDFVLETVNEVKEKYGSELTKNTLVHSDRGTQYSCQRFVELLKNSDLRRSMSRKANCWDNAHKKVCLVT